MYCPECGKKNVKGSKFCEACGAKLEEEVVEEKKTTKTTTKNTSKPMSTSKKVTIIAIVVVVIALIVGYNYFDKKFSASSVAMDYFEAVMSNDADYIYKSLGVENKGLTSKENFKKALAKKEETEIVNKKISSVNENELGAVVTIEYTTGASSSPQTYTVSLVKSEKKKFVLFDDWNPVASTDFVLDNVTIDVPVNSEVTIGGEKIEVPKQTSTYYRTTQATVKKMFKVDYDLQVKYQGGLEVSGTFNPTKTKTVNTSVKLTDKQIKQMKEDIPESLDTLFENAINNKSWEDIKDNYTINGLEPYFFTSSYDYMKSYYKNSYDLKKIKFNSVSIDPDAKVSVSRDGIAEISMTVDYTFEKGIESYFSKKSGTANYTMTIDVGYKDGKYIVLGLSTYYLRFY